MGKAIWGPFGPMTGKVGNLIYYRVNGVSRVRSVRKVTNEPTIAQLRVRQEMKVITQFLKLLTEVIKIGFSPSARGVKSPFNLATSYNKRHALTGEYPDITVNYSELVLSKGHLSLPEHTAVEKIANRLRFTWTGAFTFSYPRPNDQAILVAVFPDQQRAVYDLTRFRRSDGSGELLLPDDLIDQPAVAYMMFASADRKTVSDSLFLGWVNANG